MNSANRQANSYEAYPAGYASEPDDDDALYAAAYQDLHNLVPPELFIPLNCILPEMPIGRGISDSVFHHITPSFTGHFGEVYRAELKSREGTTLTVAVKTLKGPLDQQRAVKTHSFTAQMSGMRDFLQEGLVMANFRHNNVMPLIGISFDERYAPLIVTPYMVNGDLHKWLSSSQNVRLCLTTLSCASLSVTYRARYSQFCGANRRGHVLLAHVEVHPQRLGGA